jgi:release factor glutamine methyltransferase
MTYKELRAEIFHSILQNYDNKEADNISFYLMEERLGWKKNDWVLHGDEYAEESFIKRIRSGIERLKKNEPLQYVLGYAYFFELKLKVNSSVLIPRPETEELVQWVLEDYKEKSQFSIIDIGTGSGCIALALKQKVKNAEVVAVDFDENALHVAIENARHLKLEVHFEKYNILKNDKNFYNKKFDIILSNPPYILPSEKKTLAKNVTDFEPHNALFTPENDALFFYRHIIEFAKINLANGGKIFFEIAPQYCEEIKNLLERSGAFSNTIIRNDLQGKQRMIRSVFYH